MEKHNDKWAWTEELAKDDAIARERKGMILLLIFGIILFAGGFCWSWQTGALDAETFTGQKVVKYNLSFIWLTFNSPWLIGLSMISAAGKYFYANKKR